MGTDKAIHTKMLYPSDPDMVTLGVAVEARFLEICELYQRTRGVALIPPKDLNADMLRWREMMVRWKGKDFRNTLDERNSTRRIAEWTVQEKCKLCDQPYKPIEWAD